MSAIEPAVPTPPGPPSEASEREAMVEQWMAVQLLTERQMYQLLHSQEAKSVRNLTLLELDLITQLSPGGETSTSLAASLQLGADSIRAAAERLIRRGLLSRRGRGRSALLERTEAAEQVIALLRQAQVDLLVEIFGRMPAELQERTIGLLQAMTAARPS
ncbi:MAG TPA: hypothetical protein VI138_06115 [Candidatus Dormibacteraeota bacterium]